MFHHPEEPCHSMLWSLRWTLSAEAWLELEARCVLSESCSELEAQGLFLELEVQRSVLELEVQRLFLELEAQGTFRELEAQGAVTLSTKPEGLGSWWFRGAAGSEVYC
jgi:hypothetical protein